MTRSIIELDAAAQRCYARNRLRTEGYYSGGYRNAAYGSVKNRALDGQPVKYNTPFPFPHKDRLVMFSPGCFGDLDSQKVSFCIDHELSCEIATTNDGLSLIDDDESLQIRLDLERAANGHIIAHLCQSGNREAMSVHCDILESKQTIVAGHEVQVVTSARLKEVSLVKRGAALDNAFAFLVDTTVTPKPVAGSRTKKFETYNAMFKLSRKVLELKANNLDAVMLSERIAALQATAPIRPMTVHESNRQETERIERWQSERRASLGL